LQRQERGVVAHVRHAALQWPNGLPEVRQVFVLVRGVDHEHQTIFEPIHETVVLDRPALVEDRRVLHLSDRECRNVVRGHLIGERHRVGTGYLELAHVAHVEKSAMLAHGPVLCRDATRVLDRHLVPGERDHFGAQRDVNVVKRCALERLLSRSLSHRRSSTGESLQKWLHGHATASPAYDDKRARIH